MASKHDRSLSVCEVVVVFRVFIEEKIRGKKGTGVLTQEGEKDWYGEGAK